MAITQNTYTGNGSTVLYSFTFPYLETTDIKVSINGVNTTAYTFANATTIQFNTPPAVGAVIRIYRDTDDSTLAATFYSGSAIRAQDLNDNFTQNLYVTQELNNDTVKRDGSNPMLGDLNMGGFKVVNLSTPVAGTSAATKDYVDSKVAVNPTTVATTRWTKTAAQGQQTFSGLDNTGNLLTYAPTREQVHLNGALLQRNIDYTADDGSTVSLVVPTQLNDVLMVFSFNYTGGATSGAGFAQNGTAAIPSISFADDIDTGIFRPSDNQFAITTGGTEKFRIDANGNTDIANGKEYRIGGIKVLDATSLGSNVQITSTNIANGTIVDVDINSNAGIAHSKLANISAGNVLIGNASNVPTATQVTGDVTINSAGVTAISSGVIVDADVSATAEIAVSKLADGAARQLLQTDAAGTGVEWTSNVDIPGTLDVTSTATFDGNVTVAGNLTVNGTTITNQNLTIQDKNIVIGNVASPTDVTADGGGITLKGTVDKTITWLDATDAWTSSEHLNIASGKEYRIGSTSVLSATNLGSGITVGANQLSGTIPSGVLGNSSLNIGTTSVALNRASANQALTGISSVALPGSTSGSITVQPAAIAGTTTITLPATNGTVITTGDSGTVTSTMIANGTIVDGDINASANIVDTKLATISSAGKVSNSATTATNLNNANAIVARDASGNFAAGTITATLNGTASNVVTNANLTGDVTSVGNATSIAAGVIVNADVNASAAIDGTKISPNFGAQNITTTGTNTAASFIPTTSTIPANGVYLPAGNTVGIATNSVGRLFVDSNGILQIDNSQRIAGYGSTSLLVFRNSTGTASSPGAISSSTALGGIFFTGNDGSVFRASSAIYGYSDSAISSGSSPGGLQFLTTPSASTTAQERLRITSAGLVGVGTSSPGGRLDVQGGDVYLGKTAQGDIFFSDGNDTYVKGASNIFLQTPNGSNRITVKGNTGNVGIGTTSPGTTLDVAGNQRFSAANPALEFNNGGPQIFLPGANTLAFATGGGIGSPTERARIDSSGRLLVGTSSTSAISTLVLQGNSAASTNAAIVRLAQGTSSPADGSTLGSLSFHDTGHQSGFAGAASISAARDGGTWTSGASQPARLVFSTTADGASSPTERMRITSTGRVGIGTAAPTHLLQITSAGSPEGRCTATDATASAQWGAVHSSGGQVYLGSTGPSYSPYGILTPSSAYIYTAGGDLSLVTDGANSIKFATAAGAVEKMRLNDSGNLLIGTTTTPTNVGGFVSSGYQLVNQSTYGGTVTISTSNDAFGPHFSLAKSRGGQSTIVAAQDSFGSLRWAGANGTNLNPLGATIEAFVDGTPSATSMPGRIVLSTTASGSITPTERMRITNGGFLKASDTGTYQGATSFYHELRSSSNGRTAIVSATNASFTDGSLTVNVVKAANSNYQFVDCFSGDFADKEINLRGDGNGLCDGAWTGGGADYAEYFEWSDSNPNAEDRRGISVVLDGDKIREAVAGEDPIGVISGNPSVVGDAAWNKWSGKYLRDEFGTYIQEDYEVADDDGNTVIQQRRKLNPAYDPDVEYISREQRHEWDCVGLMGKLRIRKGQVTGSRWIKMRDINDSVEEWLVR